MVCEFRANCVNCGKSEHIERDIQLCENCLKFFNLDDLWRRHDLGELDALDFNENEKMRDEFRNALYQV